MIESYKQLQEANESIETTDVKGKQYAEVNQRVKAFRMLCPGGSIITNIISNENGVCVMQATIYDEAKNVLAKGTAYEKEGSTFINKTSYIENCETSAVGRALGFAGFGIDVAIRSAEEEENAQIQQEEMKSEDIAKKLIDTVKVNALIARCKNDGVDTATIEKLYKVKDLSELTEKKYSNINAHWDEIKEIKEMK